MHCLSVFRRNTLKTIGEFSHRPSKLLSNVRCFRVSNRIVDFWAKEEERKKSKVLSEIRLIQFAKRIWFPCNDFRTNYFPHFDVYIVAVIVRCSLLLLGFFQVFDVLYVQLEAHCDFILCDLLSYVHCTLCARFLSCFICCTRTHFVCQQLWMIYRQYFKSRWHVPCGYSMSLCAMSAQTKSIEKGR